MKKAGKIFGWIFTITLLSISGLVISFKSGMQGSDEEREKIKTQAENYVRERFKKPMRVYDTFFDNIGN
ncbi:hypothetical protein [Aneurinibacillus aneurinilyticus]|uniref:hypothetical protein n=1 Tax=Aneurinibacillus aneurinilyticus TaxID=1391 RepID=UPI003524110A